MTSLSYHVVDAKLFTSCHHQFSKPWDFCCNALLMIENRRAVRETDRVADACFSGREGAERRVGSHNWIPGINLHRNISTSIRPSDVNLIGMAFSIVKRSVLDLGSSHTAVLVCWITAPHTRRRLSPGHHESTTTCFHYHQSDN